MSNVKMKWDKPIKTAYLPHLEKIRVTIMDAPGWTDLLSYMPEFVMATWEDSPRKRHYSDQERDEIVKDVFRGKLLPTALETVKVTMLIENLDLIDVTHIIRHRMFSFSAQCTADRDLREDNVLVKPSISSNAEFFLRYVEIVDAAKQLYADMVDSKEVSIFDARTILPRSMSNFYYMSGSLKDFILFIQTRKDEAIQPESDNVIAIRMYQQLVRYYPILEEIIKFGEMDEWFVKTAMKGGHNSMAYLPKKENDVFDYSDQEFIYNKRRDEFPGAESYLNIRKEVVK